jgi:4'-phosphopantetheinyl transferase
MMADAAPVSIDLWLTRITSPDPRLSAVLSPTERERWQRLLRAESRDGFLASRSHMRTVLAGYLGVTPNAIPLAVDERGKPNIDRRTGYQFNLSHAGGWAIMAVTKDVAIGVDLEPLRPVPNALAIARRFFPPSDYEAIAALPEEARSAAFLISWTLKEALAKADGRGIELLSQLVTGIEPVAEPGMTLVVAGCPYAAVSLETPSGLLGAVAAAGRSISVRWCDSGAPVK